MRWNILELATSGRYVKLHRGFLIVMDGDEELGRVMIDELCCLMLTAEQATLSKPVMVKLADEGVPIVICGTNYHPVSLTLPYSAHHQSTRILRLQIESSLPLRKRLWRSLVVGKINHQAIVLSGCCPEKSVDVRQLKKLSTKVKSGDPENIEAQASKVYWRAMMGKEFRRNSDSEDFLNSALNYGYSVIRAACARAVVAAGLLPALGLHHQNQNNPFCLVDDLMEVYRPLVDWTVAKMESADNLSIEHKKSLTRLLQADVISGATGTTVTGSMQKLAFSLAKSYEEKEPNLQIPELSLN